MIDIKRLFLIETAEEALQLTKTTNILDAETAANAAYLEYASTPKVIAMRIMQGLIGLILVYITFIFPPALILGGFFIVSALFSRAIGKRQLRNLFRRFNNLTKIQKEYPELTYTPFGNLELFFSKSAFLSQAAKISDPGYLFLNQDKTKHAWDYAGYCNIFTRRERDNRAIWQFYYVFIYNFKGTTPQMLLLHSKDLMLAPNTSASPTLLDICPPWQSIIPNQYEIEALAILSPDILLKLTDLSKSTTPCSLEVFDSKLICMIPVDTPNINEILTHEKTAGQYAALLLPKLINSNVNAIGDIPATLDVDYEPYEKEIPTLEDKKFQQKALLSIFVFIPIFFSLIMSLPFSGLPPEIILLLPVLFVVFIVYLMPKRLRAKWLRGSGLRINGRSKNTHQKN